MNINLVRFDGGLQICPCPPYLSEYLKYSHRSFGTINYQRVNKYETRLLYVTDGDGNAVTLQGFFTKVCMLISKNMDTVTVDDRRTPLPEIDWNRVKKIGLRDYQIEPTAEFLTSVRDNSGIANCTGGWGKTILQAVTYAAFNKLNTILAIPLKEVFKQTYNKFVTIFPEKHIGCYGDGMNDISEDITITTFASLKNCALEKCQLLLVDEIQQITGEKIQDVMTKMSPIRVLGYTATDKNLFNKADKLVKGLFGERLIHIEYPEAEESNAVVPGLVYMVKVNTFPVTATTMSGKISQGVKNCKERNKLVGDICRLIPNKWQTIVFVEHVTDHMVKVYAQMPKGSRYLHRLSDKKRGGSFALSNKQQNEIIKDFLDNKFQHLICSDAFRAGVDVPNARVVIQASSGSSEVEILQEAFRASRILTPERQALLGVDNKTHFVLIDFLDSHDSTLENMSLKRMDMYEKQGWKVLVVDDVSQINWEDYK